ncbi:MAG: hypothetical protein GY937_16015 [bacterium]|nr:hypothetical protein [bacterium]
MTDLAGSGRRLRDEAFTLIEMMFVMLFTAIVMTLAINFYLQLSRQSAAAVELTEDDRRAALVLDRIARELQETVLIKKPAEVDPLAHPWFFLAEASRGGDGADRLKFQTRAHRPRSNTAHESDLATVAFFTAPNDAGDALELLRWSQARLPESLDAAFPRRDDTGVQVLAEDVASFGVRLQDENGEWSERWDSAIGVEHSSQLPIQIELRLSLADPDADLADFGAEPEPFLRRVVLPIRPLDLEPEDAEEADEEDEPCITVAECEELNPQVFDAAEAADPIEYQSLFDSVAEQCFDEVANSLGIDPGLVQGCE